MAKQPLGMGDGIQRLVSDLALMDLSPDADHAFIHQVRMMIVDFMKQAQPQPMTAATDDLQQEQDPFAMAGAPPMGEMGMPMEDPSMMPPPGGIAELSRGPKPNPDMSGAISELSQAMGA